MIRKATINDAKAIYELVESFARKGDLLHRSLPEIYDNILDFFVYEEEGRVLGVCALHVCWEGLGEIRSLAVDEKYSGRGVGRRLVEACLNEAKALGIKRVFTLTYRTSFFERMGFRSAAKESLPHKIWGECIKCSKFPNCDENALIIEI